MAAGPVSVSDLQAAVADFKDPETGRAAAGMNQIRDLRVEGTSASLTLALTTHSAPIAEETRQRLADYVRGRLPALTAVSVQPAIHERPAPPIGQLGLTAKSVIAVGSGKGGVGKSTIAAVLALGLSRAGCKVGLMDADVYGPSIPHLLGLSGRASIKDNKIEPFMVGAMPVMSMGFFVQPGEAVVFRGPKLHGAIVQFLRDTAWGNLDYLIIDLPPGTGDVALTLSQSLPLAGAVVVCTPQEVALLDAVKAIAMFRLVNVPVLGVVENMSGFICPDCHKRYDIFGSGGARRKAEELNVPFLGEVPLNMHIRESGDAGQTLANYDDKLVAPYLDKLVTGLARTLAQNAAAQPPLMSLPVLK